MVKNQIRCPHKKADGTQCAATHFTPQGRVPSDPVIADMPAPDQPSRSFSAYSTLYVCEFGHRFKRGETLYGNG